MKKLLILIISLVLVITLAACSPKETVTPVEPTPAPVEEPVEEPIEEPEPEEPAEEPLQEQTEDVTLYFGNNEYILTGDEKYEFMLTEVQTLTYGDITIEEAVVRALIAGPTDTDKLSTGFPETIVLNSVEVLEGIAYVDFSSEGLYGGSMQESYVISQTVESLTSLDSVDKVQFLIDGKEAESLMGHIDIRNPFEGVN